MRSALKCGAYSRAAVSRVNTVLIHIAFIPWSLSLPFPVFFSSLSSILTRLTSEKTPFAWAVPAGRGWAPPLRCAAPQRSCSTARWWGCWRSGPSCRTEMTSNPNDLLASRLQKGEVVHFRDQTFSRCFQLLVNSCSKPCGVVLLKDQKWKFRDLCWKCSCWPKMVQIWIKNLTLVYRWRQLRARHWDQYGCKCRNNQMPVALATKTSLAVAKMRLIHPHPPPPSPATKISTL